MKPRPEIKGLTLVQAIRKCQELTLDPSRPAGTRNRHVYRRSSEPEKMLYTHPDPADDGRREPMTVQWLPQDRHPNPEKCRDPGEWTTYDKFSVADVLATDWEVVYFDLHLLEDHRL